MRLLRCGLGTNAVVYVEGEDMPKVVHHLDDETAFSGWDANTALLDQPPQDLEIPDFELKSRVSRQWADSRGVKRFYLLFAREVVLHVCSNPPLLHAYLGEVVHKSTNHRLFHKTAVA